MKIVICVLALVVGIQAKLDIFHIQHAAGRYKIPSASDASKLCQAYNGRLASLADVTQAQKEGYDKCVCGWLDGGHVGFALSNPRPGCGDKAGVRHCPNRPQDWGNWGWDAFCVRDPAPQCKNEFSFGIPLDKYNIRSTDWAQLFVDLKFPGDGKVVGWEYYSLRPDMQAYVSVWRQPDIESVELQMVGRTRLPLGRVGHVKYFTDEHYQIEVKKGDFIGIHYDSIIDWKNNNDAVIPMAQSPKSLCTEEGRCVEAKDMSMTVVLHRHEQQLAYKRNVVINLNKINEKLTKYRAPAIRPVFCANNAGDLPTATTTTTTTTTVAPELTTPSETEPPTPEAPEITEAPEMTKTPETEPPTEATEAEVTESTTEKPSPPPTTTTTTEAPTTTTTESPTTGSAAGVTEGGPDVAEAASRDVPCHFPFMYRKQMVYACTSVAADKPWCSTEEIYDGSNWRFCHEGDIRVEDMPCHFPFSYKGSEYNSCIKAFSERPWCSVVSEYNQHSWKYCTDEDSVEATACHIPFEYKGKQMNMCIKAGSANFWCATAPKYGPYSWRNCHDDDPIPSNMPCHFPFIFEGKEVNTCISKGSNKYWCAVEKEYNGENWRNCKEGDVFPEPKPCHLPFSYNGQEIKHCIAENSNRPWCSLIPEYNYRKDWRYCRNVEVMYLHGHKVKTVEEAKTKCKDQHMTLAMDIDVSEAFELGEESCDCGWVSSGKAVRMVHEPRKDCNEGGDKGVHACKSSEEGFVPICVVS